MKLDEVRSIARTWGIAPGRRPKVDLIRAIQCAEGNFDCFATAYDGACDQDNCLWREDCFGAAKQGERP